MQALFPLELARRVAGLVRHQLDQAQVAVRAFVMDGNALQRVGEAVDIANAAAWLAGPTSRMVTGTAMVVDGGRGAD